MKNFEKNKLIAIILSIITGIIFMVVVDLNSPKAKMAFTEPVPTQKEYDILKEYALQVAKGEIYDENEDVKVEKELEKEFLRIKIETKKVYGVEANFPISATEDFKIEDGTVKYEANIDYENATYSEYTLIQTKAQVIVTGILWSSVVAICIYVSFYWGPKECIRVNRKNKKK